MGCPISSNPTSSIGSILEARSKALYVASTHLVGVVALHVTKQLVHYFRITEVLVNTE